jgi:hypothetical protein
MRSIERYLPTVAITFGTVAVLVACSDPVTPDDGVESVRLIGDTAFTLEPTEHRPLAAQCFNRSGRVLSPNACRVSWAVSAPAIATVSNNELIAQREGATVVTARVGAATAQATVNVRWGADARISIGGLRNMEEGEALLLRALVRDWTVPVSGVTPGWSTSDPGVATVAADGLLTAVGRGTATITAQLAGLSASSTVVVARVAPEGFGYVYLPDAYDLDNFVGTVTPPLTRAFTKGGTVDVSFVGNVYGFGASYPSFSFGWTRDGPLAPVRAKPIVGLTRHAFSLDSLSQWPCEAGSAFVCSTRGEQFGALEAVALTGAAFTGTAISIVVKKPGEATEDPRAQVRAGPTPSVRHVVVDGVTRRDVYWFVTPFERYMVSPERTLVPHTCVVAPADDTPADIALAARCANTDPQNVVSLNVAGFAANAHREGYPAVFAEVSASGGILRSGGYQLTVSTTRRSDRTTVVTISGTTLSAITRWPALLVTPVTTNAAARCAMAIPSAAAAATLDVIVRCSESNVGFMFGAVY